MTIKAIVKNVLNLIYPMHCEYCKRGLAADSSEPLCPSCRSQIKRNADIRHGGRKERCHFTLARSACVYEGVLKELIHSFKYKGKIALADRLASYMIELALNDAPLVKGLNAVTFVPMQDGLARKRDYNHSQVLAGKIARELKLPLIDTLRKIHRTKPQNELSREERLRNVVGAFGIKDKRQVMGLSILLIDDVMTTGATLDECAKVLVENGAREVRCLTLSRGI